MEFNEKTKLIDILKAYPELEPKLKAMDPRLGIISTPMGKMLLKTKTVQDASSMVGIVERLGLSPEQLAEYLGVEEKPAAPAKKENKGIVEDILDESF